MFSEYCAYEILHRPRFGDVYSHPVQSVIKSYSRLRPSFNGRIFIMTGWLLTDTIFVSTCSYPGFTEAEFILGCTLLKEQYPVTAHAPNFDFWTGCREIKRCEESKRILKNPFALRLAGFNTTLKLLRIIDQ